MENTESEGKHHEGHFVFDKRSKPEKQEESSSEVEAKEVGTSAPELMYKVMEVPADEK